jgi:hypothetical protein
MTSAAEDGKPRIARRVAVCAFESFTVRVRGPSTTKLSITDTSKVCLMHGSPATGEPEQAGKLSVPLVAV